MCLKCFGSNHTIKKCKSSFRCKFCNAHNHNSLLHFGKSDSGTISSQRNIAEPLETNENSFVSSPSDNNTTELANNNSAQSVSALANSIDHKTILLSTAQMGIIDSSGKLHKVRALLNCASQGSFITENVLDA